MVNLDLISTREAAARLGVTPQTIARRVARGELHPIGKGAGVRGPFMFDSDAIDSIAADAASTEKEGASR